MFTQSNTDGRNVLHMACNNGSMTILHLLLEKAGPDYLNCLEKFVNAKDDMGVSPIYCLCHRGFRVKKNKNKNG